MPPTYQIGPTLDTILIGEILDVTATLLDQDGGVANPGGGPPTWDTLSGGALIVSVLGTLDPRAGTVEGIASGTDTMQYHTQDAWGAAKVGQRQVTVLAANGFRFTFATHAGVEYDKDANLMTIRGSWDIDPLTGVAIDARRSDIDYSAGITDIVWSHSGTHVKFLTGGGAEVDTITGTLTTKLRSKSVGNDVVILTAKNSLGQTITGQINIKVVGLSTITLDLTPPVVV